MLYYIGCKNNAIKENFHWSYRLNDGNKFILTWFFGALNIIYVKGVFFQIF